jgi:hypothetical protein
MRQNGNGNGNGNGDHGRTAITPAKRTIGVEDELAAALSAEPAWLQSLRAAMGESIQGDDLKSIMLTQIEKAKGGDRGAADFVFKQAHQMMRNQQRNVTVVQNNFYGDDAEPAVPDNPADPRGLERLRRRARAGVPIAEGAKPREVSDEEEKDLHRREEEEAGDDD